jgi:hypothetical protein
VEGERPSVDDCLASVARAVKQRRAEISRDLRERIVDVVPELRDETVVVDLLLSSVESNVTTLLDVLQHGIDPDTVEPPAAALERTRTLAERGVPVQAQMRAYRVGHGRFLETCMDEVGRRVPAPADPVPVIQRLVQVSFRYIDRVSERIITTYQEARERWLLLRSAARTGRVRELLDGDEPDVDTAEAAVGYRLRRTHVGLISWIPEPTSDGEGLARLDRVTVAIADLLDSAGPPLFAPFDHATAWSWVPVPDARAVPWQAVRDTVGVLDPTARVAAGDLGVGLDGFRQTHQQARTAQDVADVAAPGARVTVFADVAPVALMLADVQATRGWVWQVLGRLARTDEQDTVLRETLRVFLSTGGSYTAAARDLGLHRNTVQYRVRRCQDALGYPVQSRRQDIELALRVCEYIGAPILRS